VSVTGHQFSTWSNSSVQQCSSSPIPYRPKSTTIEVYRPPAHMKKFHDRLHEALRISYIKIGPTLGDPVKLTTEVLRICSLLFPRQDQYSIPDVVRQVRPSRKFSLIFNASRNCGTSLLTYARQFYRKHCRITEAKSLEMIFINMRRSYITIIITVGRRQKYDASELPNVLTDSLTMSGNSSVQPLLKQFIQHSLANRIALDIETRSKVYRSQIHRWQKSFHQALLLGFVLRYFPVHYLRALISLDLVDVKKGTERWNPTFHGEVRSLLAGSLNRMG